MATYKVSYLYGDSYSSKGEFYVDNVYDEYDAVEVGIYKHGLTDEVKITKVELICE